MGGEGKKQKINNNVDNPANRTTHVRAHTAMLFLGVGTYRLIVNNPNQSNVSVPISNKVVAFVNKGCKERSGACVLQVSESECE